MSEQNKNDEEKVVEMPVETVKNEVAVIPLKETKPADKPNTGVYTHIFKTPFVYAGTTYQEIIFHFERLNGRDMIAIENEMQMNGEYAIAAEASLCFQVKMAAKAAGIGNDVLEAMPLKEFTRITNAARSFLLDTGY